jgi:uncharacterized repeat protein (TIGR03803 family)
VSADSWLYGTTITGGSGGYGTVFKLNTNGTGFMVLKEFAGSDGADPTAALVLSGMTLYGTTKAGGNNDFGTVFKINTEGSGFAVLKQFMEMEGRYPAGGLAVSGTTLYGTTRYSGSNGFGTVFKLNSDGSSFTVLKHFDGNDGGNMSASLVLDGRTLYGASGGDGATANYGLLFKMDVNGSDFTIIKRFTNRPGYIAAPGTLAVLGTTLYGTTFYGGASNCGTVFQINTDGTGYAGLKEFSGGGDGANPAEGEALSGAGLVVSGGTLYGTASRGGSSDNGVVFSLTVPAGPPIIMHPPRSQTVGVGYPVELTVEAAGSPVLTYHWFFDTTNAISGETNAALELASVQLADAGVYTVVVSNAVGAVTSAVATLTVLQLPKYRVLHDFTGDDGWNPNGNLALSGTTLYGTTAWGGTGYVPPGSFGYGGVFKLSTDGGGFTVLKRFTRTTDGGDPFAGLVLSGSTLYGTTAGGGVSDFGTVFQINTDGSGYSVLKFFGGGDDGDYPVTRLALAATTLYGTTHASTYSGVVFKLNTNGSGYTVLKSYRTYDGDGAYPDGGLVLSGSTLYGTTSQGGENAAGTVFRVNTDSSGFAVLKDFSGSSDGEEPRADLLLSGATLCGTTIYGGSFSYGTVFQINTDGSGSTVLKHFSLTDGAYPTAGLLLVGTTLVGTTSSGGAFGKGTVFKINTDGSGYTVVKDFAGSDGANPSAGLVLSGKTLYGTTANGGAYDRGVVFALSLPFPIIVTPPMSQTAETGSRVAFRVTAAGDPVPVYQWFFNATNGLDGATTNSALRLANVQPAQAGAYTVVVTNAFGTVTSAPASLSVIPPVERRPVPALTLMGQPGSALNLDFAAALGPASQWTTFDTVLLNQTSQWYFDVSTPLPPQVFYRAWQPGPSSVNPSLELHLVPAITLRGDIGHSLRLDYINQFGPTDAWVTLATVTLTNTSQLYFDTSAPGQPERLYRLVP